MIFAALICVASVASLGTTEETEEPNRLGKILPIFQVVRFPNDVCTGTTRNGTCFTAEECSNKNGVNEGACASGFGVCCVISLACGGSTSENNSYIVQSSTTTAPATPCKYDVCPCNSDICRIRYDFTTHTLATQTLGTSLATGTPNAVLSGAIGDCATDQFSISSPGSFGSPVICGTNTGQHMILDSDGSSCQQVNFNIGASTTTTRSWDIYVTQYTCGQEDIAGPRGCLQYYSATSGVIKSFGYLTTNTASSTSVSTTHLQNQDYEICFRRGAGNCYQCYFTWAATLQHQSFGLSVSNNAIEKASIGTQCTDDYITIPQGTTTAIAAATAASARSDRFCGRFLSIAAADTDQDTVCTRSYPFRLGVKTDDNEACVTTSIDPTLCEADLSAATQPPGGITGFALNFYQGAC